MLPGAKTREAPRRSFKKIRSSLGGKNPKIFFLAPVSRRQKPKHYFCRRRSRSSNRRQRPFLLCKSGPGLSLRLARFRRALRLQGFRRSFHRRSFAVEARRSARRKNRARRDREQDAARQGEVLRRSRAKGRRQDRAWRQSSGLDQRSLPRRLLFSANSPHRSAKLLP